MPDRPPSQNAGTHFMTSTSPLIPGESQQDLDAHLEKWHRAFPTDEPLFFDDVSRAAHSAWRLLRSERRFHERTAPFFAIPEDKWTPKDHADFQLAQRYLTAASRTANRDRTTVLQNFRERRASQAANDKQHQQQEKQHVKQVAKLQQQQQKPTPAPATIPEPSPHFQFIQVSVANGKTITSFTPSNAEILADLDRLGPNCPVKRTLRFQHGHVPPEYAWLGPHPEGKLHFDSFTADEFRLIAAHENGGPVRHCTPLFANAKKESSKDPPLPKTPT